MLSGYRVLDLTDERGDIAGMVLGDLGADVIKVEPPGGSPSRRRGLTVEDAPESESSLDFFAYNRNKRGMVIDLGSEKGRETFLRLAESADFVLESAPPGELSKHGISFDTLRAANPRVVHVRITPYGDDGPYADYAASDLVIGALAGQVWVHGVPDRAPIRISAPQVWRHAGVEGAVAALMAHARMGQTGKAQSVDVSAQSVMTWTLLDAMGPGEALGDHPHPGRAGSFQSIRGGLVPSIFACRDGDATVMPVNTELPSLFAWLVSEGALEANQIQEDWTSPWDGAVENREIAPLELLCPAIEQALARYKKRELLDLTVERGFRVAPLHTLGDLLQFEQLEARGCWQSATLPNGQEVRMLNPFMKSHPRPLQVRCVAPGLDEHGDSIRASLNARTLTEEDEPLEKGGSDLPLAGVRVLDLTWAAVGPISARYFADHGAEVVHVESSTRMDVSRTLGPFKDGIEGLDRSQYFAEWNASKLSLQLDLKQPGALAIAERLVEWADVYIENLRPGAVGRLGLGYERVREINPSIIMISTSLMGQSGPRMGFSGFGFHAAAVAGFYDLTGWPDLPPDGPYQAHTDVIGPRFVVAGALAALDHKRRTGEGCFLDCSQLEMATQFLSPELLFTEAGQGSLGRLGNRALDAAPHGVYPCIGEENWCAIAVETNDQWSALLGALGKPTELSDPAFHDLEGRLAHQDEIDKYLSDWTSSRESHDVMRVLQAVGVPAGVVQRTSELLSDPQYRHRGFYHELEHPVMGRVPYVGHSFRIRGYPSGPRFAAPTLGQHNLEVMENILGMSKQEIAAAFEQGLIR